MGEVLLPNMSTSPLVAPRNSRHWAGSSPCAHLGTRGSRGRSVPDSRSQDAATILAWPAGQPPGILGIGAERIRVHGSAQSERLGLRSMTTPSIGGGK